MKKICFALVGVLFSTLVFAYGTDEPTLSNSSVAITRTHGSSLFKVYYSADMKGDVKISIRDKNGISVFSERIKNTNGFIRPYNFEGLKKGEYVITIETGEGSKSELVKYGLDKENKLVNIVRLSDNGKYLLSAKAGLDKNLYVNIFNQHNELVYSQNKFITDDFAEVLNLKKLKEFTIEVYDDNGLLKLYKNF